jgi:hypothetical protein
MDVKFSTRKRIWEIDCRSMETVIAASFEWRELANLVKDYLPHCSTNENILEIQAYGLIHQCCHSENPVSLHIEELLNYRYQRFIETVTRLDPYEAGRWIMSYDFEKKSGLGGMVWALGSDAREGFDCLRRHFHQRLQVYSIRKLL